MPFVKSNFEIPLEELQLLSQPKPTEDVKNYRPVCVKCGVFGGARGSAYVEFGRTRVLAQIHGPREDGHGDFHNGNIVVTVKGYEDEKLRAQIKSAVSGIVQLNKYAKSQIEVEFSVLSADGGILQAALIASSLALSHAGIEVLDVVVAAHIAVSPSGEFLLDPAGDIPKDFSQITMGVMPNLDQVVCCDVRGALTARQVNDAISFGIEQSLRLYPVMRKALVAGIV